MSNDRRDAGGYMGWFLFGAVLGAGVALLMAPKTGAQARELLAERGGDVARRAQEFANEAQGRAGEWIDKSREIFEEQTQRLMSAFEAGRDAKVEALAAKFAEEEKRYNAEKKDIEKDAKKLEAARDHRRERHPYFEFGEVLLQIAIVSASVAILSTSRQMFWFSLVLAVLGAGLTVNGFVPVFKLPFLHHH